MCVLLALLSLFFGFTRQHLLGADCPLWALFLDNIKSTFMDHFKTCYDERVGTGHQLQ